MSTIPQDEEYSLAYIHFRTVLKILTEDAESQCKHMGYYNVAWELQDDAVRGAQSVLNLSNGNLSTIQIKEIQEFMEKIHTIPQEIINTDNNIESHLLSMKNSCWEPLRIISAKLLNLLPSQNN